MQDVFIACVDGLKGFLEAIEAVFPKTQVQLVHRAHSALQFELRQLEITQDNRGRSAHDLYGRDA